MTLPFTPHAIVILDRRPEYARLLAALAATDQPALTIEKFDDLEAAEQWLATAPSPVAVFADVTAADGATIRRALAWRAERLDLAVVAMFDANNEVQALDAHSIGADGVLAKPCCRSDWRQSVGALLGERELARI